MKSFYEHNRDEIKNIHISKSANHNFPAHFHLGMEFFILKKGEYSVVINGEEKHLTDGCVFICDSFDIHTYTQLAPTGEDMVIVIPYGYLTRFNSRRRGAKINCPVVCDKELCDRLIKIVDDYLISQTNEEIIKASVELFLATLEEKLQFTESKTRNESALIKEILFYIHENFKGDATRKGIAKALGYTEAHISRVFHKYLRINVSEYVNELRLNYVKQGLKDDDTLTVTQVIYEAGFKSQQTYYRVKKAHENS